MERKLQRMNSSNSSVDPGSTASTLVYIDCAIFGFDQGLLNVLLKPAQPNQRGSQLILPGDALRPDEDLDLASYRIVKAVTGLEHAFVEQVRAFGKKNNHPSGRMISAAHYCLVDAKSTGINLMEKGLQWYPVSVVRSMPDEQKTILEACLGALQTKIQQEPIVFNLLPAKFSLRELQQLYEGILGTEFDRRNFRKKLFAKGLLRDENEMEKQVRHRPGKLYSFDHLAYNQHKKQFPAAPFF